MADSAHQPDIAWIADDVFTIHHGWLRDYVVADCTFHLNVAFGRPFERRICRSPRLLDASGLGRFESGSRKFWMRCSGESLCSRFNPRSLCVARGIQTGMFLMWGYEGAKSLPISATIEHVKRPSRHLLHDGGYLIKGTPPQPARVPGSAQALGKPPTARSLCGEGTLPNLRTGRPREEVSLARLNRGQ